MYKDEPWTLNDTSVGVCEKKNYRRNLKEDVLNYLKEDNSRSIDSKELSKVFKCASYTSLNIIKELRNNKLIKMVGIKKDKQNFLCVYKSIESSTPTVKVVPNDSSLYRPLKKFILSRGMNDEKSYNFIRKYMKKNNIEVVALSIGNGRYCEGYPLAALNEALEAFMNKPKKRTYKKKEVKNKSISIGQAVDKYLEKNPDFIKKEVNKYLKLSKTCTCEKAKSIFKFKIFGKEISLNIK